MWLPGLAKTVLMAVPMEYLHKSLMKMDKQLVTSSWLTRKTSVIKPTLTLQALVMVLLSWFGRALPASPTAI